ncbi:hypothetical protein X551_04686 [Methylibium sp. T29]|nr:hypothetical protein X551_04686 [Methylibium sp. T29]EWS58312.1 hypothetical protein Y694_03810 [Methylibium sp. T29-B]
MLLAHALLDQALDHGSLGFAGADVLPHGIRAAVAEHLGHHVGRQGFPLVRGEEALHRIDGLPGDLCSDLGLDAGAGRIGQSSDLGARLGLGIGQPLEVAKGSGVPDLDRTLRGFVGRLHVGIPIVGAHAVLGQQGIASGLRQLGRDLRHTIEGLGLGGGHRLRCSPQVGQQLIPGEVGHQVGQRDRDIATGGLGFTHLGGHVRRCAEVDACEVLRRDVEDGLGLEVLDQLGEALGVAGFEDRSLGSLDDLAHLLGIVEGYLRSFGTGHAATLGDAAPGQARHFRTGADAFAEDLQGNFDRIGFLADSLGCLRCADAAAGPLDARLAEDVGELVATQLQAHRGACHGVGGDFCECLGPGSLCGLGLRQTLG